MNSEDKTQLSSTHDEFPRKEVPQQKEESVQTEKKRNTQVTDKEKFVQIGGTLAAAGIGGVVGGAIDGELVEAVFTGDEDAQAGEVDDAVEPNVGHIESISFSGSNGEVFTVTTFDGNGDGQVDVQAIELSLEDGSSATYVEMGDYLDQFVQASEEFVAVADQIQANLHELNSLEVEAYEIQPGDTLSELAALHGTTVSDIMELNPQLSDENVIVAGEFLELPNDGADSISPIDDWEPDEEIEMLEQEFVAPDLEGPQGDYASIEWSEFSEAEEPMDGPYQESLNQIDFEQMDVPSSFVDDGFTDDGGMVDDSGFGFI